MTRRPARIPGVLLCALLLASVLLPSSGTGAEEVDGAKEAAREDRYFSVWHYANNEPAEEFDGDRAGEQTRGYWRVEFDAEGAVTGATYYDSRGNRWLSYTYVEADGRIFADLYGGDGKFVHRKGTRLSSRVPRMGVAGK
ncbi:MAG: hypothetical protein JRG82_01360 [Deltaproteobacteria bacterium]|nr:hypothetical protein [Deltaproteobacteria bacterium]